MRFLSSKSLPLLSLGCFVVAAFFSKGFYHFDEHFQILEFAGLKLGLNSASDLPWEYSAKIRSALQPALVVLLHQFLGLFHFQNPFVITTLLRLLSALLSWCAFLVLFNEFIKPSDDFWKKKLGVPLSFFFCFAIFNGVRFSSENWGAIFFVFGLVLASSKKTSIKNTFASGFFLGLSFLFRFQMGIMICGLFVWTLLIKKERFSFVATRLIGIALALGCGMLVDHWFYGDWPLTFWNYFDQNLLQGRAASFGIHPWYEYLRILFIFLIPPFSLFFILGLFAFFYFYPTHVLSFCLIPFLVIHSLIGHKEARFIFPIIYFFPVIFTMSYQKLSKLIPISEVQKRILNTVYFGFLLVNGGFLLVALFLPADKDVELYEAIYRSGRKILFAAEENPYERIGLQIRYYQRPGFKVEKWVPGLTLDQLPSDSLVITRSSGFQFPEERLVYESFPEFLNRLNFNHWLERTKRWRLFWS